MRRHLAITAILAALLLAAMLVFGPEPTTRLKPPGPVRTASLPAETTVPAGASERPFTSDRAHAYAGLPQSL